MQVDFIRVLFELKYLYYKSGICAHEFMSLHLRVYILEVFLLFRK